MTAPDSPALKAALDRSALVTDALACAREAHAGQVRNGSGGMPYVEHPMMVAALLAEHGYGEEVVAAALLHDVVEDSETTVGELRERFGEPVAGLVAALSDDESIEDYRERKEEHRARVRRADGDALAIYGADKLTNVETLRAAFARESAAVAEEFKVPLELKLEVWRGDLEMLRRESPELPWLPRLAEAVSLLSADLAAAGPRAGT
ncbi:MAG: HD domain-containing protein [Solirubrobacterales bacterium]